MIKFTIDFIRSYFRYGVSRCSAGLAYYLMFSFFPLILFVNSIIGFIDISILTQYEYINIFPHELQVVVTDYLEYLTLTDSLTPLFVGLFLTLYSFTRYVNSLYHIINNIYGFQRPRLSIVKSFFFTVTLMLAVYLTLLLTVVGGAILNFIYQFMHVPSVVEKLFVTFRYLIPMVYFFAIIVLVYRFIPSKKLTFKSVLPGSFFAVICLFIVSVGFSIYIENFSNYSVIYGSLSVIMFLMLWLYFSSMVIVQGSILNKMLADFKKL